MKKSMALFALLSLSAALPAFGEVIQDWTSLQPGMAGTYLDSNGSKVDYSIVDGPQAGQKALQITYNLVASGYVGVYTGTSLDLSKDNAFQFMAKSTNPGDMRVVVKDAFNVQYYTTVNVPASWTKIVVPFSDFKKDDSYTPPDAVAGHPMDLSSTTNLNFSPQATGASVVDIGPVEVVPGPGGAPAAQSSAASSQAPAAAAAPASNGSSLSILDLGSADEAKAGGTSKDPGSTITYSAVDNPNKPGTKYLVIKLNVDQGGYACLYHRTGSSWDGQDWSGGKAIRMLIYCKDPVVMGLAIQDKNHNQYSASAPSTKGGSWEKVEVPIDSFKLDPYYTPPNAVKGAPMDLSQVIQIQFQPKVTGEETLAISDVTLVK
jgi:Carbohydrate binding domain (family 11)